MPLFDKGAKSAPILNARPLFAMKQYKSALIKLFHSWTHSDAQKPDNFNLEQGLQRSLLLKKPGLWVSFVFDVQASLLIVIAVNRSTVTLAAIGDF